MLLKILYALGKLNFKVELTFRRLSDFHLCRCTQADPSSCWSHTSGWRGTRAHTASCRTSPLAHHCTGYTVILLPLHTAIHCNPVPTTLPLAGHCVGQYSLILFPLLYTQQYTVILFALHTCSHYTQQYTVILFPLHTAIHCDPVPTTHFWLAGHSGTHGFLSHLASRPPLHTVHCNPVPTTHSNTL